MNRTQKNIFTTIICLGIGFFIYIFILNEYYQKKDYPSQTYINPNIPCGYDNEHILAEDYNRAIQYIGGFYNTICGGVFIQRYLAFNNSAIDVGFIASELRFLSDSFEKCEKHLRKK